MYIACTEQRNAEAVRDKIEDLAFSYGGYSYQDGMSLRLRYTFDLASSDERSEEMCIVEADGTEHLLTRTSFTYDGDFDYTGEGSPLYGYFHAGDRVRTVAVTYGPGTEAEVTRVCEMPLGTGFLIYRNGQTVEAFFTDPECTQLYGGSDGMTDLQLYVP